MKTTLPKGRVVNIDTLENFARFNEDVFDYLEFLGVPDLVIGYDTEAVARSFAGTINICYKLNHSFRMTAIIIFALTMHKIMNQPLSIN